MTKSKMHPPSTQVVHFWTKDGRHTGFFMKHANAFVRNVNRWKDTDTGKWYDDSEVTTWEMIPTYLKNE